MIVTCETKHTLKLEQLTEFQGGLKIRTASDVEKIVKSIKKYGFATPFFVWRNSGTNYVLDGHGRLKALQVLSETEYIPDLPIVYIDCKDEESARNILLRICSQYGKMTEESVLAFMGSFEYDFTELSLPDGFLDLKLNDEELYTDEELEEIPETVETRCNTGDIWQLGRHFLICGDSTKEDVYTKLMGGGMADLLITDPPYNCWYEDKALSISRNKEAKKDPSKHENKRIRDGVVNIENDHMNDKDFLQFLKSVFVNMEKPLKKGGGFYIFHSSNESFNFYAAIKETSLKIMRQLIWVKNTLVMGRHDYHLRHEPIIYGWKKGKAHYFIDDRTQDTVIEDKGIDFKKLKKDEAIQMLIDLHADKISTTIIREDKPTRNAEHPTMKPVKLISRLIKNSSRLKDIVLDPFGGSGSTLIACEQLQRSCRTIEISPEYCDVILQRWENLTGETAVKVHEVGRE